MKYLKLLLKYFVYRIIEGCGSNTSFKILFGKFDISIYFDEGMLKNMAIYRLKVKHYKNRISFWVAFQEKITINKVKINGKFHKNYKLYTIQLPMFNYRINYLSISKLSKNVLKNKFELLIEYRIKMSNLRNDLYTMLENYISSDEFHLYNLWFPILANKITIKDTFAGEIPKARRFPYKFHIRLSKPGIIEGDGEITKITNSEYIIENHSKVAEPFFICGGKLKSTNHLLDCIKINFYYRSIHANHFIKPPTTLLLGMKHIIGLLRNFDEKSINIYFVPIIAGGYGLFTSILINENFIDIPLRYYNMQMTNRLIWHEFIHWWWENRISAEGPGKYLLTEGMAVLFEWLTAKHIYGEEYFNIILENAKSQVLEIRGFESSIYKANRKPPFGNVIVYNKCPIVLYQLLKFIGEKTFIDYCRIFLEIPGIYQWKDFLRGLEEYSDINLTAYNSYWICKKNIPKETQQEHIILLDKRTTTEKKLDYSISRWKKNMNYKKFSMNLDKYFPQKEFWNKYYYYKAICTNKSGKYTNAMDYCEKMNGKRDLRYYWQGIYLKTVLNKKIHNRKKGKENLEKILTSTYPIDNLREVFNVFKYIEKDSCEKVF